MDPVDVRADLAPALSEGLDCLAVFLCGPALLQFGVEAQRLLDRWEAEHARLFRAMELDVPAGERAAFLSALAQISAIAAARVDLTASERLAPLRAAVREVLTAMRIPLAPVRPGEAAVCELHGPACPFHVEVGG